MKWLRVFEFISPSSIYSKLWALDCPAHLRLTSLRKILFQSEDCVKETPPPPALSLFDLEPVLLFSSC